MNNNVLIIDDHPAVRMTIRFLFEEEGYDVVGEADNGEDALVQIDSLRPDLIILDIGLPKIDGLTILARLAYQATQVKIIVLTAQESNHLAIRCMQLGAHGFVNKNNDLCELVSAARAIEGGDSYFPSRKLPSNRDIAHSNENDLLASLTNRELRVLQQLAQGMSDKEIGERMLLTSKTISTYKIRLLVKLNASNLFDLYELAKLNGFNEYQP